MENVGSSLTSVYYTTNQSQKHIFKDQRIAGIDIFLVHPLWGNVNGLPRVPHVKLFAA